MPYTLTSKRGTITRTLHTVDTLTPDQREAEQADLDRREFQLSPAQTSYAAAQEAKDAREMAKMINRGMFKDEVAA